MRAPKPSSHHAITKPTDETDRSSGWVKLSLSRASGGYCGKQLNHGKASGGKAS
jgi:hypothetical protein